MKDRGKIGPKGPGMVKRVPAAGSGVRFDPPVPVVFRGRGGRAKCAAFLEFADTPERRRAGLSKRASLGRMSGMLFDCTGPFWMKDVEFPLDLVFTDESGRITEKTAMALDRDGSRRYPAGRTDSANAIELPSGFCDAHGVEVGDEVVPVGLRKDI